MANLTKIEGESGFRVYVTPEMAEYLGVLVPHFADFAQRDFLILSREDITGDIDTDHSVPSQDVLDGNKEKLTKFFNERGINARGGFYEEEIKGVLARSMEKSQAFGSFDYTVGIDGREVSVIFIEERNNTPQKMLANLGGLWDLENSPGFAAADRMTTLAFALGHESAHVDLMDRNVVGDSLEIEVYSDREGGFSFLEYLKEMGVKVDAPTKEMIAGVRSIGGLHLGEKNNFGVLTTDQGFADMMRVGGFNFHATGLFLKGNQDVPFNPLRIEAGSVLGMEAIYRLTGNLYRGEYEELMASDPEAGKLIDDKRALVRSYRPSDPMAMVGADGKIETNDSDLVLGWRISQAYPDIHYSVTKAAFEQGEFDVMPEIKALVSDYLGSFEKLLPGMVNPEQTKQISDEVTRARNSPSGARIESGPVEIEPVVQTPKPSDVPEPF